MLITYVTYHLNKPCQNEFIEELNNHNVVEETKNESGNLCYDFFISASNKHDILLIEKWQDCDALAYHKTQPAFANLQIIKKKYGVSAEAESFEK